jgi:D-alanine--poly(phosphoribitol) ligase subunit 1
VLTYGDLESASNRAARVLRRMLATKAGPVAIAGTICAETYAAIVGCLKLGIPYSVFDPDSPSFRLERVFETLSPSVVIGTLEGRSSRVAAIDHGELGRALNSEDSSSPAPIAKDDTDPTAYVMFTSGSTGVPKGAAISHGNLEHLIGWSIPRFAFGPGEVLTGLNPLHFDNSVFDLYSALFSGACLAPFPRKILGEPLPLVEAVEAAGCTSWFSVPSLLVYLQATRVLDPDRLPSLKRFIFGGEGYPKPKLEALFSMFSPRISLVNVYGPTECTCICSEHTISEDDFRDLTGFPPLGELLSGFSYQILANKVGDEGELMLSGPAVGQGYFRDPARTAESFEVNSDSLPTTRSYRTGDVVRLSSDSDCFHFVGRVDRQIKHMGYRIELDEIETALNQIPQVTEAAVVHGSIAGLPRLFAAVGSNAEATEERLLAELAKIVPAYMLPSEIEICDLLPKNANGKIDRAYIYRSRFGVDS